MADTFTRLSTITFSDIDNLLKSNKLWKVLTDDEKMSKINLSTQKIANFKNSLGYRDYFFDTIDDADKVLSPTPASVSNMYADYIQLDIASDGTVTANTTTAINFTLDYSTKSGTDPITYIIALAGATVKSITLVDTSIDPVNWSKDTANNKVTIIANSGHGAFSVFVKNLKET